MIPIAAVGLLNPLHAAGAMATDSIAAVNNSALLKRAKFKSNEVNRKMCCGGECFMAKDPVCGMTVDEKKAKLKSEYKGKTYYFCAASCKVTFDKNPAKYASA
jgi:YHS domain-containing protein